MPAPARTKADALTGNRLTRRAIFGVALGRREPFTAAELEEHCRKLSPPVSRATVYRTLRLLTEEHLLREVVLQDGRRVYLQAEDDREVIWVCEDCQRLRCLSAGQTAGALTALARQEGFFPSGCTIEARSACQAKRTTGHCPREEEES